MHVADEFLLFVYLFYFNFSKILNVMRKICHKFIWSLRLVSWNNHDTLFLKVHCKWQIILVLIRWAFVLLWRWSWRQICACPYLSIYMKTCRLLKWIPCMATCGGIEEWRYSWENIPGSNLIRGWVGTSASLETRRRENYLPGIEPLSTSS
jgi:hypothetical protein